MVSTFHPVLGTVLELQTTAVDDATVAAAERVALATIDRLEDVFSIHRPASALSRWRAGDDAAATPELVAVLAETEGWFVQGEGAFNPFVGRLVAAWRRAETTGAVPDDSTLAAEARAIAALPYTVRGGVLVRRGECGVLELHAIAKGWIADRATEAGLAVAGVEQFGVNLGCDLRHGCTG